MDTGLISSRYADSLLQYAAALRQQEEVYDRLRLFSVMFMKMPALRRAVMNPSIVAREKKKILTTACGGSMPSSLSGMIDLIFRNEREEYLLYIALRFIDLYMEKFNIRRGKLVTAVAVDADTRQRLTDRVGQLVEADVKLESVVDPAIIGGFILSLGDFRWDASIAGELARVKNDLIS